MQQTQNYKLNKPETTDPFTPAPLNENADKLESELTRVDAAVAQCRAENCLVKLGGPLGVEYKGQPIVFDLSGVDLSQYIALILVGGVANASSHLCINGDTHKYALHASTIDSGGFTFFTRSTQGKLVYNALYGDSYRGQHLTYIMSEIQKISLASEDQMPGSNYTLYGVKA